jgi:hypothetical protein
MGKSLFWRLDPFGGDIEASSYFKMALEMAMPLVEEEEPRFFKEWNPCALREFPEKHLISDGQGSER